MHDLSGIRLVRALADRRGRARLVSRLPLFPVLAALLAGQLLGSSVREGLFPAIVASVVSGFLLLRPGGSVFVAGFLLTVVPGLVAAPPPPSGERSLVLEVVAEPRYRTPGAVEFTAVVHGVRGIDDADPEYSMVRCKGIDLPWRPLTELRSGSVIAARGDIRPIAPSANPFSYEASLRRSGVGAELRIRFSSPPYLERPSLLADVRSRIRSDVERIVGRGEASGVVLSMAFGVRDVLSIPTEEAFKQSGLAHLLVFSGYQVSLCCQAILTLVRVTSLLILRDRFPRAALVSSGLAGTAAAGALVLAAGAEAVTIRALVTVLIALLGRTVERRGTFGNSICGALIVVCSLWPGALFEPGLELTAAALVGLAVSEEHGEGAVSRLVRSCFYASACTGLVTLVRFGTFSILGFVLNPIAAPALGAFSCIGSAAALLAVETGIDTRGVALGFIGTVLLHAVRVVRLLPAPPRDAPWAWYESLAVAAVTVVLVRRVERITYRTARGTLAG